MPERQVITSLTGTAAPLLTVDSSNPEALDYSSIWLPRQWKKSTPFVCDEVTIPANNQTALNVDCNFEIPKLGHMIYDLSVHHLLAPRVTANPPLSPGYYVDHLGYAIMDYFRIYFGSNTPYERQMYDLYFRYRKQYSQEKRDTINELIQGDRTIAQRTNTFLNGGELFTDMMLPFGDHYNMALPIVVLSQKTRFTYRTKALQNIINLPVVGSTASTAANQLDNIELIVKVVHLTGTEADMLVGMSQTDPGIAYMIHQEVRQLNDEFGSTVPNYQAHIKLSGITKPIMLLQWALIPSKLVNDTGRNDFFFFAPQTAIGPPPPGWSPYTPIQNWDITANGQIIQRQTTRNYNKLYNWYKTNESPSGDEIFTQNYSMYPHSVNSATGYLDYTTLNNPVLNITFGTGGTGFDPDAGAPTAQLLRLIVIALDYNFWFLKSGNWSRTFN